MFLVIKTVYGRDALLAHRTEAMDVAKHSTIHWTPTKKRMTRSKMSTALRLRNPDLDIYIPMKSLISLVMLQKNQRRYQLHQDVGQHSQPATCQLLPESGGPELLSLTVPGSSDRKYKPSKATVKQDHLNTHSNEIIKWGNIPPWSKECEQRTCTGFGNGIHYLLNLIIYIIT